MATKAGRPCSDNPRNVQMRIRLTKDESDMLKKSATALNKTMTDIVVMGIEKVYADTKK